MFWILNEQYLHYKVSIVYTKFKFNRVPLIFFTAHPTFLPGTVLDARDIPCNKVDQNNKIQNKKTFHMELQSAGTSKGYLFYSNINLAQELH